MTATQNRKPPAYQEYASEMLASTDFRMLNLTARGLLYTLRLECWANGSLPSEPGKLATILGVDGAELSNALRELRPFFDIGAERLTCPDLEGYRAYLADVREGKAAGGRKGTAQTNAPRKVPPRKAQRSAAGHSSGVTQATRDSLVESNPRESNSAQQKKASCAQVDHDFLDAYDRASNGF